MIEEENADVIIKSLEVGRISFAVLKLEGRVEEELANLYLGVYSKKVPVFLLSINPIILQRVNAWLCISVQL